MNGTTLSITQLKQRAAEAVDFVVKNAQPLTILQRSSPRAVLVDADYFMALEEALLDTTDSKEAEKAKKETKDPLEKYIKQRWDKINS
ncbi:MAG: hypothetical protein US60_C0047G0020 [Microgenomates group bacterium GW2011_GWC1_37_8]|uniref:Antitoxin n=2 Tax=Candidatus Woeseibacteriota TaxID=1752722 RepID=A0A0G0L1Q9_9BACT|nr:MAG: hypothetical protein US60_C0047G0020 [Microgenomates group bacterium GW2011_GWC1_37_8]KKQ85913.1 MAG: hypothetical protein UT08_C0003G0076 [Candidatus Woesebacteria bacterium GW2011_GWB1_38_8]OGM20159.1 MAG: hypothetical protein A2863_00870 [Candidatus Woesebacteria bacterium RIFCSPHIGHO2_01_FULL_38_9b]